MPPFKLLKQDDIHIKDRAKTFNEGMNTLINEDIYLES